MNHYRQFSKLAILLEERSTPTDIVLRTRLDGVPSLMWQRMWLEYLLESFRFHWWWKSLQTQS